MAQLNSSRVIIGGLAAGLVMNVIDATTNGFLLGNRWMVETETLNPGLLAKASSGTMGWVVVDFILGVLTVWVYAAIRPRLGPGPSHRIYRRLCHLARVPRGLRVVRIHGVLLVVAGGGEQRGWAGSRARGRLSGGPALPRGGVISNHVIDRHLRRST